VPKILVADDNTNIQKMVSLAFSDLGIDVVSVGNGEAAVRRIPDLNPDLVLADIFMPVRNGYEVCEFVKKDSRFSHVPVILLVGAFDPLDEKEARRVGADGVLKKPFVPPDPLIAMVTSALEKNPKLAAELAKAREVVPAPAAEPMTAILEAPVKAEVKPLPEYPEPTAEEAALIYGFGSGKRGAELDAVEENGPKPPVAPEVDEEEEEVEETSPSRSWRRNAMDFEVPEETSKNMAFALDDETAASMFPSEKDVPPKHVSRSDKFEALAEKEAAESATAVSALPTAVSAPPVTPTIPPAPAASAPVATAEPARASSFWGSKPATPAASPELPKPEPLKTEESKAEAPVEKFKEEPPAPMFRASSPAPASEPVAETPRAADVRGSSEESVAAIEIKPVSEASFASRSSHWMDAVSSSTKASDQWAESGASAKVDLDAQQPIAPIPAEEPAPLPVNEAPLAITKAATLAPGLTPSPTAAPTQVPSEAKKHDPFFADDLDHAANSLSQAAKPEAEALAGAALHLDEPAESPTPAPVIIKGADPDWLAEPEPVDPMRQDPDLVVPPSVRVTPEPLLVNEDETSGPSGYGDKPEKTEEPFESMDLAPNGEPADVAVNAEVQNERIPTGPPPNREVLAEIPFLSPPPEVLAVAKEENGLAPASSDVDDMVRKVLEKLEPRLHDLLSQGVLKPLVEDALQNEMTKKK
jgi:CheY-like chemotaxis protein